MTQTAETVHLSQNLTDRVTTALIDEITSGRYAKGDVLGSEKALAERFGVSRTILREALSRVKAEGLVVTRQGHGVIVQAPRRSQIFQIDPSHGPEGVLPIVELRIGVESEAAALAAERRSDADLETMAATLDTMAQALDNGDLDSGVEADLLFHRTLYAATKNPHYIAFHDFLHDFLKENILVSRTRSQAQARREMRFRSQDEHRRIFDAIAARDPDRARDAVRDHVGNTARRLREEGS